MSSLRNFSRLDEAEFKAVNIHEGIDSALMILSSRFKSISTTTPVDVIRAYGDLPKVMCYAGELNQVFMNLLTNALDALAVKTYTPPDRPRMTIATAVQQNMVEIRIEDNGCGIDPAIAARIFDPFFTTKPVGQGTGLGLSISYHIVVQRHQGGLTYRSTPDKGTIFMIRIPLNAQESVLSGLALPVMATSSRTS